MDSHPVDPVALIAGLLFTVAGTTIIVERNWKDVDVTAFSAAGVALAGLLLAAVLVSRFLRDQGGGSGEFDPSATAPSRSDDLPFDRPDTRSDDTKSFDVES